MLKIIDTSSISILDEDHTFTFHIHRVKQMSTEPFATRASVHTCAASSNLISTYLHLCHPPPLPDI